MKGKKTAVELHRELGHVMWENVGMARSRAGLQEAIDSHSRASGRVLGQRERTGTDADLNMALERANRVADFMEFGELVALDALAREESCGGHFRVEYQQTDERGEPNGEAKRDDARFCHVAAWEYAGPDLPPVRLEEPLMFENVKLAERSYK